MHVGDWLIAMVIGLFLVISMPVVQADAYVVGAVTDLTTMTQQRSVTVHVSEPGRYVLHVAATSTIDCHDCEEHSQIDSNGEAMQRFATIEAGISVSSFPSDPASGSQTNEPLTRFIVLASPPPRP